MNAAKPKTTVKLDRLQIGMHVRLDGWLDHPFLFNSFKIKNQQQLDTLRNLSIGEIEFVPEKSDVQPAPAESTASAPPAAPAATDALVEDMWQKKRERIETLNRERQRIVQAEKKYVKMANTVKSVMQLANANPVKAVETASEVANTMADAFIGDENPFIHLMGEMIADESAYFHALNVMVLSMILARFANIELDLMKDIALGALLHDIGKAEVPSQILLKDERLTHAEQGLLHMHPQYGIKLLQPVHSVPRRALEIVLFHHEAADGSGYPKGLRDKEINPWVRIVNIANAYDNHCNQRQVNLSKTPAEALSHMFRNETARYDRELLGAFIKCLGIYPPGTVVKLASGRVGIVISVDGDDLLHPNLMLYDPKIPKADAPIINLRRDIEDKIEKTLRPASLPGPIFDYLSPRRRICYFVNKDTN